MGKAAPLRKNIFFLSNYVVGWQSRSFLAGLLHYWAKNMALLVIFFSSKSVFGKFKTKKSIYEH